MRPCATYWTCHPWKQNIRWSKSRRISMRCRIPRIHSTMLSKKKKGCRLARSKSWMGQAEQSIQRVCSLTELKQVRDWEKRPVEFKPYYKTLLSENLGTHCREWPAGKTNVEVQMLVEANSKPHGIVIYTDGSVTRVWLGVHSQAGWKDCARRQWSPQSHDL